jgi:hypothetical protein
MAISNCNATLRVKIPSRGTRGQASPREFANPALFQYGEPQGHATKDWRAKTSKNAVHQMTTTMRKHEQEIEHLYAPEIGDADQAQGGRRALMHTDGG